ncbi:response regulator [Roseibium sp. Sym1]|uniref:response regulator n=1 Tax=Roseibium sp. Sym1 TaxID=3016006 RepID=UPI0022B415D6|nr:response regulator [Roseibium sp. Sym1]
MNAPRPHIVVCDDEASLRRMVSEYLSERGYDCTEAMDAQSLRERIARRRPDLIVLDVRMPGEDGLSVLRSLRADPDSAPVIMLTAAADTIDRVVGLELGADDYVGKPVDLRELDARIKAVLRRSERSPSGAAPQEPETAHFGDFTLDVAAAALTHADGSDVPITAMEFALLKVFVMHPNRVLSRDQLLDLAHHRGWEPFDRSIDLRISRLRRKIEPDPDQPRFIRTVRGIGYIFSTTGADG